MTMQEAMANAAGAWNDVIIACFLPGFTLCGIIAAPRGGVYKPCLPISARGVTATPAAARTAQQKKAPRFGGASRNTEDP